MEALAQVSAFLVDNQELIRNALIQLLSGAGLDIVGGAETGQECVRIVVDLRPDVVLVEPFLNGSAGIDTIQRLSVAAPASRILVLTGAVAPNLVVEAILAGASGYLLKDSPPDEIVGAVRASAAGQCVISPRVAGDLVERVRERDIQGTAGTDPAAAAIRDKLSERELEIFRRLASGRSNREIGRQLALSENTVKNHVARILAKLHIDNRIQAAVQGVRSGIS